jgi:hypothetical protein
MPICNFDHFSTICLQFMYINHTNTSDIKSISKSILQIQKIILLSVTVEAVLLECALQK